MARLNEPPVSTDSFDALRRKFLRQNRDIARINSNQSLRIRGLENECARLLSENLDLRGQVLRLEKELESNSSQRIADHALQVKRKMETQLLELSTLLADFGLEPPKKRPSPAAPQRSVTKALARLSLAGDMASPPVQQRRPPALAPQDAESLAAQEGRLPPIYEDKTYPRQALTKEELRALLLDDSTATESPELVSPPVSRLFHDEPRKSAASPSRSSIRNSAAKETIPPGRIIPATANENALSGKPAADTSKAKAARPAQPASSSNTKQRVEKENRAAVPSGSNGKAIEAVPVAKPTPSSVATIAIVPAHAKAGAKRKYTVNEDNTKLQSQTTISKGASTTASGTEKDQTANSATARELKNPRSIRDLVNSRSKDAKESGKEVGKMTPAGSRRPLAAKSTNEDISSPRKRPQDGKPAKAPNESTPAKPTTTTGGRMRDRMKHQQSVPLVIPGVAPPPVVVEVAMDTSKDYNEEVQALHLPSKQQKELAPTNVDAEPSPPAAADAFSANIVVCPSTPPPLASLMSQRLAPAHGEGGRDTPPPADISSQGETTRPSRRARTSVSYVEPNLRDKMRRPTKELFDAVAGEGKYVQRQQHQIQPPNDEAKPQASSDTLVQEMQSPVSVSRPGKQHAAEEVILQGASATNCRRRRASSVGVGASSSAPKSHQASTDESAGEGSETAHGGDPYDFLPSLGDSNMTGEENAVPATSGGSRKTVSSSARASSAKATRRSSAAAASAARETESTMAADRHTRPSAARKRASMAALKHGSMLDSDEEGDDPADSSYEPLGAEGGSSSERQADEVAGAGRAMPARDRISRRRSMML